MRKNVKPIQYTFTILIGNIFAEQQQHNRLNWKMDRFTLIKLHKVVWLFE